MAFRILNHKAAGSLTETSLEPARWADLPAHAQFLLDVEFLTRCSPASGTASCIFCKSPSYLNEIAQLFPWIYFYAYEHSHDVPEYDPAEPCLTSAVPVTVQVQANKTTSALELTKDMARTLGDRSARERESLLLICHDLDPIRQLALQVLMRPSFAFMDIAGPIPNHYLHGELFLPIYLPNDKLFCCLLATQFAKATEYDQELYVRELGETPTRARLSRVSYVDCYRLLSKGDTVDTRLRRKLPRSGCKTVCAALAPVSCDTSRHTDELLAQHTGFIVESPPDSGSLRRPDSRVTRIINSRSPSV